MFERIKMRIIQGRTLKPFATAAVLQDHEDRLRALEGSEPEPEPEPVTRDISVTVNDGTDPIEGATVSIGDKTGTTGSAGGCTLKNVTEGRVQINVTKDGFTDYSDTINVSADNTSFTISLTAITPSNP